MNRDQVDKELRDLLKSMPNVYQKVEAEKVLRQSSINDSAIKRTLTEVQRADKFSHGSKKKIEEQEKRQAETLKELDKANMINSRSQLQVEELDRQKK
jgi:hypothetical protein